MARGALEALGVRLFANGDQRRDALDARRRLAACGRAERSR